MKRILVIRPDAIGDVVLMIPFLNTLRDLNPDAEIFTLQQSYTQDLLNNHPAVTRVILDPRKQGLYTQKWAVFAYAKWLESYHFDVVYFSYLDGFYAMACALACIPIRIGDGNRVLQRMLLTHPVSQRFRALALHEVEQNLTFCQVLHAGFTPTYKMDLVLNAQTQSEARQILKQAGWAGQPLIGIHPATGGGNRPWTPLKYASLINKIHQHSPYRCVLTGFGEKEKRVIDQIVQASTEAPFVLYNKTTLEQLKGILKTYACMIGTDTGPTHMAAALQIPVLCISPTKFVKSLRWGPWQTPNEIVGRPQVCHLRCNPHRCRLPDCLDAVTVKDVFLALDRVLKQKENQDLYASPSKSGWFVASCSVCFVIEKPEDTDWVMRRYQQAREQNIRAYVLVHANCPKPKAIHHTHLFTWSVGAFKVLRDWVVAYDITVIHVPRLTRKWYWFLLRQWVAPRMYVPPVLVTDDESSLDSTSLIDRYLNALS